MIWFFIASVFCVEPNSSISSVSSKERSIINTKGKLLYSSQSESFYYKSGELVVYKNDGDLDVFYTWPDVAPNIISDGSYVIFWATNINTLICFRMGKLVWSWIDVRITSLPKLNRCRSYIIVEANKELICIQRGVLRWKRRCSYVTNCGQNAILIDRSSAKSKLISVDCSNNNQLWSVILPKTNISIIDGNVCYEQKGKVIILSVNDGSKKIISGKIRNGEIIPKAVKYLNKK